MFMIGDIKINEVYLGNKLIYPKNNNQEKDKEPTDDKK